MTIDKKQVENIAQLARLDLSKSEIAKMQKELAGILTYIEQLKQSATKNTQPTNHSVALENVMRPDQVEERPVSRQILEQMPEREGDYLKTRQIL